MAGYSGMVLTNKGIALQAKAQTGTQLQFTKVKLGSGTLPDGTNMEDLTELITPVMSLGIQDLAVIGDGTARARVVVSNQNLETGFFVREVGLYAQDPQEGEILYCVTNAGSQADFLPAGGGSVVVEQVLDIITVIGNAQNITAIINYSLVLATKADIEDHNNDPDAHDVLKALHLWQPLRTYQVGDSCYSKNSSYKRMICTVAGVSESNEPTWPDIGQSVNDGTATWRVHDVRLPNKINGQTIVGLGENVNVQSKCHKLYNYVVDSVIAVPPGAMTLLPDISVTIPRNGIYVFTADLSLDGTTQAVNIFAEIRINGNTPITRQGAFYVPLAGLRVMCTYQEQFNAGDTIDVFLHQVTGGTISVNSRALRAIEIGGVL